MSNMTSQRGFTLLELFTVLAILGLLAAISIGSYLNYATRAKVSEALTLATSVKLAIRLAYQEGVAPPFDNEKLGLPEPTAYAGQYISAIAVSAIVTCSPVATIASSSRGSGSGMICFARPIRRLVSPDIAETTTTTWWPSAL